MKKVLCAILLIGILIIPGLGLTEGDDTIQLARTLYTLGQDQSYDTLLMLGTVVMNRVESPWYPDTVKEVIGEPHQFPHGTLYDERALEAAREIMMGRRTMPDWVVCYDLIDEAVSAKDNDMYYIASGDYGFYGK